MEGDGGCRHAFVYELGEGGCRHLLYGTDGEGLVAAKAELALILVGGGPGVVENAGRFVIKRGVAQARQVAGVGVVGGHGERLGSGVVVQPGSGGGVGLFENVEEEAMQAAGGDVLALNGGAVWLEGDGDLLHV